MPNARNAIYVRRGRLPSGLWEVRAFGSDDAEDGSIIEGDGPDQPFAWATHPADPGLLRVEVGSYLLPDPPAIWFVHVDEPHLKPRGTHLVAFGGDRFPPGTVINRYTFATAGVPNGEQAGAVRWYPDGGQVHQVFVAPEWRRKFVASTLLYTADAFHQANGWPGKLHGDGRRTALGQLLLAGLRHPNRAKQLTEQMPPMDPEAFAAASE